ncbi:MAG: trypsin-like peptidase domain-containing protein [Dolichospermum circinale Clear-D4]|nr:trypsin-like peptidase domain-containing protein [Dolichospermum circinale Clear-D4]
MVDIKTKELYKSYIVRISSNSDEVKGVGLLICNKYIITCAHVVADALYIAHSTPEKPSDLIMVDFPFPVGENKPKFEAKVITWKPRSDIYKYGEDIAILELQGNLPTSYISFPLSLEVSYQHKFSVLGFPMGHDEGVTTEGKLVDTNGYGLVQMDVENQSKFSIEPGFSGAPVWDQTLASFVGIVVSSELDEDGEPCAGLRRNVKVGYMIPAKIILESWSFLSLIQILTANLDKHINSAIKTAYQSSCRDNLSQNIRTTVADIVKDLYDVDKRNLDSNIKFNHNDNTAKFIKYLITNSQIHQTKLENLKKWGSNNIEDFDKLIQDVNQQYQNTDTKPESYILIKIEPLTTKSRSKIPKFKISGGVIPNIQNNEDCLKIDVSDCPNDSFKIEQIPEKINLILTEKITFPLQRDINLVFFLPTKMLNYPVEQWIITENNVQYLLGKKYRVIVRDYNRLLPTYVKYQGTWISKWEQLQLNKNKVCEKIFKTYKENHDQDILLEMLDDAIGIILTAFSEEEYKQIFAHFLNSATPIGICYRHNDQFTQLLDCLSCSVFNLPEKFKKQRLNSRTQDPNHIGHHISLIWENPNIQPTKLYY